MNVYLKDGRGLLLALRKCKKKKKKAMFQGIFSTFIFLLTTYYKQNSSKINILNHIHKFLVANLICFEKSYKAVLTFK